MKKLIVITVLMLAVFGLVACGGGGGGSPDTDVAGDEGNRDGDDEGGTQPEPEQERPVHQVRFDIIADTTWGGNNDIYEVSKTLNVAPWATLSILPGTTIKFGPGVDVDFIVEGKLNADGDADNPIIFTNLVEGQRWRGIQINDGGEAYIFRAVIDKAIFGLYPKSGSSIYSGYNLHQYNAFALYGNITRATIANSYNTYYRNNNAIAVFLGNGSEIYNNVFMENDHAFAYGSVPQGGQVSVYSNHFINNNEVVEAVKWSDTRSGTFNLYSNWWGTTDINLIESKIVDFDDDSALRQITPSPAPDEIADVGAGLVGG